METFSALLALCAGNTPVTGEFPIQRPVTKSCDISFDLRPNKQLSKQSWHRWFEMQSKSLWLRRKVEDCCHWDNPINQGIDAPWRILVIGCLQTKPQHVRLHSLWHIWLHSIFRGHIMNVHDNPDYKPSSLLGLLKTMTRFFEKEKQGLPNLTLLDNLGFWIQSNGFSISRSGLWFENERPKSVTPNFPFLITQSIQYKRTSFWGGNGNNFQ